MFNPRKTDRFFGSPGSLGVILAALIALSVLSQILSSGTAPMILFGGTALFALWWLYQKFIKKAPNSESAKYQQALKQQKKAKLARSTDRDKGNVIYLSKVKRK